MSEISKIGLNVTNIQNITAPNFNLSTSVSQFVKDIPVRANEYSNNWLGVFILAPLFGYLYYKLSDTTPFGEFRYSRIRSIALSSGITGIVGMVLLNIGYIRMVYPVFLFLILFMIFFLWVVKEER